MDCSFHNADLTGAQLGGAGLDRVDLTGADLTDADLTGFGVGDVPLDDACLEGTQFSDISGFTLNGRQVTADQLKKRGATVFDG